jgi:hypothetical protein
MLGVLVVLVLAGCSGSPYSSIGSSSAETSAGVSTNPTITPTADLLDQLSGHWKVTYKLVSVKPSSARKLADQTPDTWQCIVYNGQLTIQSGPRAFRGPIKMTGKAGGKGWHYKGKADYAGQAGELWTSDIVVDGTMTSVDAFTAKQTGTVDSSIRGQVYTATWSIKGVRIP